jgi:hypothetical protein
VVVDVRCRSVHVASSKDEFSMLKKNNNKNI